MTMHSETLAFPPPPQREEWAFMQELKKPEPYNCNWTRHEVQPGEMSIADGIAIQSSVADCKNSIQTAIDDLKRFLNENNIKHDDGKCTLKLNVVHKLDGFESYKLDVADDCIQLTAQDSEGLRRAIYFLEDTLAANDGPFLKIGSVQRKPWLKNRISRCFFGPIKRPPFNRDELLDDIDYYPDEYLNRLAHEGINGLWLTIEFRQLAETSFTPRDPQAPQRIEKLQRTVDQCLRYGIKTWIFAIEPMSLDENDPLLLAHPELKGTRQWNNRYSFCTSSETGQQYLYETLKDIFTQLPRLGGLINISHGERPTSCLSSASPLNDIPTTCPRCSQFPHWQIHAFTLSAMAKGMKEANPDAQLISWIYQPQPAPQRGEWLFEMARHVPDNVILQYNFESGAQKKQLGKVRSGGDYWLSYIGPTEIFKRVADNAKLSNAQLSAKIQVGCSHEVATVPFVPVPGLLYHKYKAMRECGCTSVMQCWYFGNYPGIMNRAAGELAFETFQDSEEDFLERLAKPQWNVNAKQIAQAWHCFTKGYANYPLSNDMQYYGPMHAGVVWPLFVNLQNLPLAPTWKPDFPPSGDSIGECLENHSLDEALNLTQNMSRHWNEGCGILDQIAPHFQNNQPRLLDIGVMKALGVLFESAANILNFYQQRTQFRNPQATSAQRLDALNRMEQLLKDEQQLSATMIPLCQSDSRLGFHSEAEAHQFCVSRLNWRIQQLQEQLDGPIQDYRKQLETTGLFQDLSTFINSQERYDLNQSPWMKHDSCDWNLAFDDATQSLIIQLNAHAADGRFTLTFLNDNATSFPWQINVTQNSSADTLETAQIQTTRQGDSWSAIVKIPTFPLTTSGAFSTCFLYLQFVSSKGCLTWPSEDAPPRQRLNIGPFQANHCGIITR